MIRRCRHRLRGRDHTVQKVRSLGAIAQRTAFFCRRRARVSTARQGELQAWVRWLRLPADRLTVSFARPSNIASCTDFV